MTLEDPANTSREEEPTLATTLSPLLTSAAKTISDRTGDSLTSVLATFATMGEDALWFLYVGPMLDEMEHAYLDAKQLSTETSS
jgi:hypothetical protein